MERDCRVSHPPLMFVCLERIKYVILYVLPWFSLYFETMSLHYHAQMKVLLVTHIFGIQRTYAFVVLITGKRAEFNWHSGTNDIDLMSLSVSLNARK